jgi:hypothetical protein
MDPLPEGLPGQASQERARARFDEMAVQRLFQGECQPSLGMAFSRDGALWINMVDFWGDSIHHGVYRVARNGSFELAVPKDGALFVVNTDRGTVVKVPIRKHGSPGNPVVFASDLRAPDGITVGPSNDLYLPFAFEGLLVRVDDDGTWRRRAPRSVAGRRGPRRTSPTLRPAGGPRRW